mgnify:CR=1 FL=1
MSMMIKVGLTTKCDNYSHFSTRIAAAFKLICMYLVSSMAFREVNSGYILNMRSMLLSTICFIDGVESTLLNLHDNGNISQMRV